MWYDLNLLTVLYIVPGVFLVHLCMLDVVGFVSHFVVGFSYCCAIVRVGSVEEEGRGDGKESHWELW
jgi:hypothetical protein